MPSGFSDVQFGQRVASRETSVLQKVQTPVVGSGVASLRLCRSSREFIGLTTKKKTTAATIRKERS